MNIRTPLIRAAVATALVGSVFALAQMPQATAAPDGLTVSVEARAPLQATLLPVVSVSADARDPDRAIAARIAATGSLSVTLMPTVFVTARHSDIAAVGPSTIRVAVDTRLAAAADTSISL